MTGLRKIYDRYAIDLSFESLKAGATQLVEGVGHTEPVVLFIGEAPGAEEDKHGFPFVGAAGQMLDELMSSIGMARHPIRSEYPCFITNIVKYRPPGNRDPKPEELSASIPYMWAEIDVLAPKVIVTLGRYSTKALWPAAPSIGNCHGWVRPMENGMRHMPMYHPAFGVYDSRNRDVLLRDFKLLKQELDYG